MRNPDFIILGETRCGSTSFYECLITHPAVVLPSPDPVSAVRYDGATIDLSQKELRFFDRNWKKGVQWYRQRFPERPGCIAGDGSATYLFDRECLVRIRTVCPETRLFALIRNPVDRLRSHFQHLAGLKSDVVSPYGDFGDFVEREIRGGGVSLHPLVERGIYARSLKNCFEIFDRSRILVIRSEDLFSDPEAVFTGVFRFLNIAPLRPALPHLRRSPPGRIAAEIRTVVSSFYAPYNEELEGLLGRRMGWS